MDRQATDQQCNKNNRLIFRSKIQTSKRPLHEIHHQNIKELLKRLLRINLSYLHGQ